MNPAAELFATLPRKWQRVVRDAERTPGYMVEYRPGAIPLVRLKKGSVRVVLWRDGTATRDDVDLTVSTNLRTEGNVREALGLEVRS